MTTYILLAIIILILLLILKIQKTMSQTLSEKIDAALTIVGGIATSLVGVRADVKVMKDKLNAPPPAADGSVTFSATEFADLNGKADSLLTSVNAIGTDAAELDAEN